jgi:7-alpha-hydroxysteroid dehydrogenase
MQRVLVFFHADRSEGRRGPVVLDRFRVTGQVAVVTGAGRGIGAATAVALAEAGADVLISARTEDQLAKMAREVEAAGRRALVVPADLADLDAVGGLPAAAVAEFGRLDIVVNNVGGAMPRPFMDTQPRHLADALQLNVGTAHRLTQAAVPHLLAGADGRTAAVINVSSTVGRVAGRGYLAYGTAKAALIHYTRLAAADLARGSGSTRSRWAWQPRPRSTLWSPTTASGVR